MPRQRPSAKSLANLKPYRKGQSGNPAGRPKGCRDLSAVLRDILDQEISYTDPISLMNEIKPAKEFIAAALAKMALNGNVQAVNTILDRLEGKPRETIDTTVTTYVPEWLDCEALRPVD